MKKQLLALFTILTLSSCEILLLPVAIPVMALGSYHYEKDVSSDPQRGFLVGKKYILEQDTFLYKYCDSSKLYLDTGIRNTFVIKNGEEKSILDDKQSISSWEIVPLGTCITISKVTINSSLGGELCVQYIYGTLEHSGKRIFVDISDLFEHRFNIPSENWNFLPKTGQLKEWN